MKIIKTWFSSRPVSDARAFCFVDKKPYVIVINSKDGNDLGYTPKIFSLMHEFGHILLRESSICNDFVNSHIEIEKFCNYFAGEFLVPEKQLIELMNNVKIDEKTVDDNVERLKKIFKVSGQVILTKLLHCKFINDTFYKSVIKNWREKYEELNAGKKQFIPPLTQDQKAFNNYGGLFTRLVLDAQSANKISYNSAAEYLDIKIKYMPDLYNLALSGI